MEESNKEKELELFIAKTVKEAGLERPTKDFTQAVLDRIEQEKNPALTTYKPLISWRSWGVLLLVFSALIYAVVAGKIDSEISWFDGLNLSAVSKFAFLNKMADIQLSSILIYSILGLGVFFYLQLWWLKNHINKRIVV